MEPQNTILGCGRIPQLPLLLPPGGMSITPIAPPGGMMTVAPPGDTLITSTVAPPGGTTIVAPPGDNLIEKELRGVILV